MWRGFPTIKEPFEDLVTSRQVSTSWCLIPLSKYQPYRCKLYSSKGRVKGQVSFFYANKFFFFLKVEINYLEIEKYLYVLLSWLGSVTLISMPTTSQSSPTSLWNTSCQIIASSMEGWRAGLVLTPLNDGEQLRYLLALKVTYNEVENEALITGLTTSKMWFSTSCNKPSYGWICRVWAKWRNTCMPLKRWSTNDFEI